MCTRLRGRLAALRVEGSRRPHVVLAVRVALAASAAWLVVQPLWGVAEEYPYYAPLGAVIATSMTVVASARTLSQVVLALASGALLASATTLVNIPEVLSLALVVGVGTAVGRWRWLGSMATWVPVSALFILMIGGTDPLGYVVAYLGLTSLGAAVGVAVTLALPTTHLTTVQLAEGTMRASLAGQLEDLAAGLRDPGRLRPAEWHRRRAALESHGDQMRGMVDRATEARRANWRARGGQSAAETLYRRARALEQLVIVVQDLWVLLTPGPPYESGIQVFSDELNQQAASALEGLAAALRTSDLTAAEAIARLDASEHATAELADGVGRLAQKGADVCLAGSVVTALRRAEATLRPEEAPSGTAQPQG